MKAASPTCVRHQYDFTAEISKYLLSTEAGAQTNWHRDFTGTCFLRRCQGQKAFLHFGKKTETNQRLRQIATKRLENIYFFWLPSHGDSSTCSAQKR